MRPLLLAAVLIGAAFAVAPTRAEAARYSNAQISSMPLLERPNRPGHFIGNTLRYMNRGNAATGGRRFSRPSRRFRRW